MNGIVKLTMAFVLQTEAYSAVFVSFMVEKLPASNYHEENM